MVVLLLNWERMLLEGQNQTLISQIGWLTLQKSNQIVTKRKVGPNTSRGFIIIIDIIIILWVCKMAQRLVGAELSGIIFTRKAKKKNETQA